MDHSTDWRTRGLCRTEDPELFYPVGDENTLAVKDQLAEAKRVCTHCPVLLECRVWGLAKEDFGVWGGMSAEERRAARKAQTGRRAVPRAPRPEPRPVRPNRTKTIASAATR